MRKLAPSVFLFVIAFYPFASVSAYNEAGHMVSGYITYTVLESESPEVLREIVRILKKHPEYHNWKGRLEELPLDDRDSYLLMLAARWPDDIRSKKKYTHPEWHYVDFPWRPKSQPESLALSEPKEENALSALKLNIEIATGNNADWEKAIALCWVFHLVGDIHQPLHTISVYSQEQPSGDAGGTRVHIKPSHEDSPITLHFYWDDLILFNDCYDMARSRAKALLHRAEYAREKLTATANVNYESWAKESYELAKSAVYLEGNLRVGSKPEEASILPDGYAKKAKQCGERQIVLASYRLADLLKKIISDAP
jgi:hypothetical protein